MKLFRVILKPHIIVKFNFSVYCDHYSTYFLCEDEHILKDSSLVFKTISKIDELSLDCDFTNKDYRFEKVWEEGEVRWTDEKDHLLREDLKHLFPEVDIRKFFNLSIIYKILKERRSHSCSCIYNYGLLPKVRSIQITTTIFLIDNQP